MNHPFKPTIIALAIAISFIVASALISQPLPAAESHQQGNAAEVTTPEAAVAQDAPAGEQLARLKSRVDLSMPYYSFGSLLPRARGS